MRVVVYLGAIFLTLASLAPVAAEPLGAGAAITAVSTGREGTLDILPGGGSSTLWSYNIFNKAWRTFPLVGPVGEGGALTGVFSGCDHGFAGGGTSAFFAAGSSCASPRRLADAPAAVGPGSALAAAPGLVGAPTDLVFALRGSGSHEYWAFQVSANTWESRAPFPVPALEGASLVEVHGTTLSVPGDSPGYFVAALAGGGRRDFWIYSLESDAWQSGPPTPDTVGAGGSLAQLQRLGYIYALRGGGTREFWRFSNGEWLRLADTPGPVTEGAGLAGNNSGPGPDRLYALQGAGSSAVWRYDVDTDTWDLFAELPGPNEPPIANAGPDQTQPGCAGCESRAILDASGTTDPDGDAITYIWRRGATTIGTTRTVTVALPVGVHVITLIASDPKGGSASDTVTITIEDTVGRLNAALAAVVGELQQCRIDAQACAGELSALNAVVAGSVATVEADLRRTFRDPRFVIRGKTPAERLQRLIVALTALEKHSKRDIYRHLGGRR